MREVSPFLCADKPLVQLSCLERGPRFAMFIEAARATVGPTLGAQAPLTPADLGFPGDEPISGISHYRALLVPSSSLWTNVVVPHHLTGSSLSDPRLRGICQ